MKDDPIVAEVRRAREQIAAKFNYDLQAIAEDARQRERANRSPKFGIEKDGVLREVADANAFVAK